jgi:hypothetical protein
MAEEKSSSLGSQGAKTESGRNQGLNILFKGTTPML